MKLLLRTFFVNIPVDCADHKSKEYRKMYVRGRCVKFSPAIIYRFMDRSEDDFCELEVTDNQVCRAITANQVSEWPMKNKLPVSKLSVKYAILHRIGAANWVPTNHTSTISIGLGKFIYAIGNQFFIIMGLIYLIRPSNMQELVPLRCQLIFLPSSVELS